MCRQQSVRHESFIAYPANVGPFTGVITIVYDQRCSLCEIFPARGTRIGFFTRVRSPVHDQILFDRECFAANVANARFFSRVYFHVIRVRFFRRYRFTANVTRVFHVQTLVPEHVSFQLRSVLVRFPAFLALVFPVVRCRGEIRIVSFLVFPKSLFRSVRFPAGFTLEPTSVFDLNVSLKSGFFVEIITAYLALVRRLIFVLAHVYFHVK